MLRTKHPITRYQQVENALADAQLVSTGLQPLELVYVARIALELARESIQDAASALSRNEHARTGEATANHPETATHDIARVGLRFMDSGIASTQRTHAQFTDLITSLRDGEGDDAYSTIYNESPTKPLHYCGRGATNEN